MLFQQTQHSCFTTVSPNVTTGWTLVHFDLANAMPDSTELASKESAVCHVPLVSSEPTRDHHVEVEEGGIKCECDSIY
eukprot:517581-Heterocapsa_arctica.AAC.1